MSSLFILQSIMLTYLFEDHKLGSGHLWHYGQIFKLTMKAQFT